MNSTQRALGHQAACDLPEAIAVASTELARVSRPKRVARDVAGTRRV